MTFTKKAWANLTDDELLTELLQTDQLRQRYADECEALVAELRRRRVPWALVGEMLTITAQGAQQRYRGSAPRERHRTKPAK